MKRKTELNERTLQVIRDYLEGDLSSRGAARELNISHQAVINLIASVFKEWYLDGKIVVNPFWSNDKQAKT